MYCLICTTPDGNRPESAGVSEFDALFGGIARRNAGGVCCHEEGGQAWDGCFLIDHFEDDSLFSAWKTHALGTLIPGQQFIDLLPSVNGFWTCYWFFTQTPVRHPDWVAVRHDHDGLLVPDRIPRDASHMFDNVDGAYWVMLTEREEDVIEVEQRWHLTERIPVRVEG